MTPSDLKDTIYGWKGRGHVWTAKQIHRVPDAKVVDRNDFIVERCRGKVVLDIGASGTLHKQIVEVAKKCYGIDREDGPGVVGCDLDDCRVQMPMFSGVELIVMGEVVEHLGNPQQALAKIRVSYPGRTVIISVPNAFNDNAAEIMEEGIECVNDDHVSWLSYTTLKTLLGRVGYRINEFLYYNGRMRFAEGLIVVVE